MANILTTPNEATTPGMRVVGNGEEPNADGPLPTPSICSTRPQRVTNEQIVTAYREKGSIWKAAMTLGICGQSVYERLVRMGCPIVGNVVWSEEETAVAKSLAEQGFTIARVAARLGRTYAAVACKLNDLGIASLYKSPRKTKRGFGLTKRRIVKFAHYLLKNDISVTKAAHRQGVSTTGLVNALQQKAPELWAEYVCRHSDLPSLSCPGCGNPFTPLTKKQKACSTQCASHARVDAQYFGGKRRNTIGLAEGICQLCEQKKSGLASHHVFGKNNDPDNETLVALCRGCHQLVGILGRRNTVTAPEFWENLISLAVVRAWADRGRKALGTHISVDIEELTEEDLA